MSLFCRALTAVLALCVLLVRPALAQDPPRARTAPPDEETTQGGLIPDLAPAPELGDLARRPIRRIEVVLGGGRWNDKPPRITRVRVGEPLSLEAARRAARELLDSGRFARATPEALPDGDGALLRIHALPRRIIATVQMSGAVLEQPETLEAAGIAEGGEITAPQLADVQKRIEALYARHGYTSARVAADATDTDDPDKVVLAIDIDSGPARTIAQRVFVIEPAADREVGNLKQEYEVGSGDRVDEPELADADRALVEVLRKHGFFRAQVSHALRHTSTHSYLYVFINPGPRLVPAFDGNRAFDKDDLEDALELDKAGEARLAEVAQRLRTFYVKRGFLDAEVSATEIGRPDEPVHYLAFTIRENRQVRVTKRIFPCLSGDDFDADAVGGEIDSFLEEELPGAEVFHAPDPQAVDALLGPTAGAGSRARPTELSPAATYAPETYDRALEHLRDLFGAKGYLNAVVGPVTVIRARCAKNSPPNRCIPEPSRAKVVATCKKDALGLPVPEPEVPEELTCKPNAQGQVECAQELTLRIPIHLGPRSRLYDLTFDGNRKFTEVRLAREAELELGQPLSNVEVEAARLRVLDFYKNHGFAYADVRTAIEPSGDRTRARVRFVITERDPVTILGFVIKGNTRTSEALIRRRIALRRGLYYQQDLARRSEERIATLGTFSSVSVSLEAPEIPERSKRVVVTVVEQVPQYLDPSIGFSTGDGIRFGVEYGHRNIGGQAISLTLRVQLSYLFEFMILDSTVARNYDTLNAGDRLERRNTATVTFPEIGLGPLISLSLEGVDVRDNQRDFGLTKDAVGPTLTHRPFRQVTTQLGGSLERNDVNVFRAETVEQAIAENPALSRLLRVPDGLTVAVAQRLGFSWDRRDNPFAATRGTLLASAVEHVNAFPLGGEATFDSHFLRFTGRVAGYVRLTKKGTAIALSVSGGYIQHLDSESVTYPDRLFFLGGVDSIRAFLADSVVPEDVAQRILRPDPGEEELRIEEVGLRGGDVMVNPRAELRVPLNDTFSVGLFLDTGNLWVDPSEIQFFKWRYGLGSGIRVATPIGPLALDYGINMLRRPWEDFGALHFSIGLF